SLPHSDVRVLTFIYFLSTPYPSFSPSSFFFFHLPVDPRDLHSFPTRRSSDLEGRDVASDRLRGGWYGQGLEPPLDVLGRDVAADAGPAPQLAHSRPPLDSPARRDRGWLRGPCGSLRASSIRGRPAGAGTGVPSPVERRPDDARRTHHCPEE